MSRKPEGKDIFRVYGVLSHPLRRRIVEILGERGSASFTDFRRSLDVRVGTLYYHFDVLKGFIAQDRGRRYVLTDLGLEAYRLLTSGEYEKFFARAPAPTPMKPAPKVFNYARNIFLPSGFFRLVYDRKAIGLAGMLAILLYGSWIVSQTRLEQIIFFSNPTLKPTTVIVLEFLLSWVMIFAVSDALALALFRRRGDELPLMMGCAYAMLPLLAFPTLMSADGLLGLRLLIFRDALYMRAFQSVLQGWSLAVLSVAIGQSKGLRMDKAAFLALMVAYLNIIALYVLGPPT